MASFTSPSVAQSQSQSSLLPSAEAIRGVFEAHERPSKFLAYGTAGFRANVNLPLHAVFARSGLLAVLRSRSLNNQAVGAMITASHNLECDNGLKLVDANGGMMSQSWEPHAERIVNAESGEAGLQIVNELLSAMPINEHSRPVVIVGRDTRPHSYELFQCCKLGATAAGGVVFDIGEVSTPQLHFVVHHIYHKYPNTTITQEIVDSELQSYSQTVAGGFVDLLSTKHILDLGKPVVQINKIVVDCSFGVGSLALQSIVNLLSGSDVDLTVEMRNVSGQGKVNEGCGAELVQKSVIPPANVSESEDSDTLLCSYDGDADRIVFHSFLSGESDVASSKWVLMDGDKIAAAAASLIHTELMHAGLHNTFSIGVVQSAYANGASTQYFRSQGITVAIAKTGVKYMHHKAEAFDIGIYFEANGHGTVLFSETFLSSLEERIATLPVDDRNRQFIACSRLKVRS
jgi:phosphoacetylglucosamine mutase